MAFRIVVRGVAQAAVARQLGPRATQILLALQEECLPGDQDARRAVVTFEDEAFDDVTAAGRNLALWLDQREGKGVQHAAA